MNFRYRVRAALRAFISGVNLALALLTVLLAVASSSPAQALDSSTQVYLDVNDFDSGNIIFLTPRGSDYVGIADVNTEFVLIQFTFNSGTTYAQINGRAINWLPGTFYGYLDEVPLQLGTKTFHVTVIAEDGTRRNFDLVIMRGPDTNANYSDLFVSDGNSPASLTNEGTGWVTTVGLNVAAVDIGLAPDGIGATFTVNGRAPSGGAVRGLALQDGRNTFPVVITADSGAQRSFDVVVIRQDSNTDYGNLTLVDNLGNTLITGKAGSDWKATVPSDRVSVDVTLVPSGPRATFTVGGLVPNGSGYVRGIVLQTGLNTIPVVVTSQSGATNRFNLLITRDAPVAPQNGNNTPQSGNSTPEPPKNPTDDPAVKQTVSDQVSTVQSIAAVQMSHVQGRLTDLHSDDVAGFDQGISMSIDGKDVPLQFAASLPAPKSAGENAIGEATGPKMSLQRLRFWSAGSISVGTDKTDGHVPSDFRGGDLALGGDIELMTGVNAGLAVGRNSTRTNFGSNDSHSITRGYSATIYGSWKLAANSFMDGALGIGRGVVDVRRYDTTAAAMASGKRDYSALFASFSLVDQVNSGSFTFAPYLQLDMSDVSLAAYDESGAGANNLSYAAFANLSAKGSVAFRISTSIALEQGILRPSATLGLRHEFNGSHDQQLSYLAIPGTTYNERGNSSVGNEVLLKLGLRYEPDAATSLDFTYHGAFASKARTQSVSAQLSHRF